MRHLLRVLLVLSLTAPCWAADDAKPNTLTPKEAEDGWLLLFDGETSSGWDVAGNPKVQEGALVFGGEQASRAATTTAFLNFEVRFEYRIEMTKGGARVKLVRAKDATFPLTAYDGWAEAKFTFEGGSTTGTVAYKDSGMDQFQQNVVGTSIDPAPVLFEVPKGAKLSLRNVKLQPRKMAALFNGKDLTGWKVFPGRKSKFSVTEEGWLSIKNGNGDLQSTGQWADFVLQLECRTNGDNLNSGVFFRCQPDKYQQGYEAQIQNQHAKGPKTYTIEEFDPKTNESKGKKKIQNWSQDYGTGAIYRRIPARRAVAKDREWFTMTVVAQGRHMATWVNGIQVVDWTDNRPAKDNGRDGYRAEKGPISLQGHDPTTDLSFRNIRIASLTEKN